MVDLKALQLELAFARRARREAEMAGLDIERVIERMQAGRTLQQIELEELASFEPVLASAAEPVVDVVEYRQAA
ncbi:MAG: hypothetical protein ACO1NY_10205 [Pseudorhodoplanes sp.]